MDESEMLRTEEVRNWWATEPDEIFSGPEPGSPKFDEFDGWLHSVQSNAAKQALVDAADEAIEFSPNGRYVADWLRARAEQIGD